MRPVTEERVLTLLAAPLATEVLRCRAMSSRVGALASGKFSVTWRVDSVEAARRQHLIHGRSDHAAISCDTRAMTKRTRSRRRADDSASCTAPSSALAALRSDRQDPRAARSSAKMPLSKAGPEPQVVQTCTEA